MRPLRFASLVLAGVLVAGGPQVCAQAAKPSLRAGAAISNITPDLGDEIVGGFLPVPSSYVHDELHARCLVLDDGKNKVALVVCDLLGVHRSLCQEAAKLVEEATGIPPSHLLISATHTHSATSAIGGFPRGYYSDVELTSYQRFVARRIADGVRRALHVLRPAEMAFGTVEAPEHVFNRRWFLKEGTMPVNPFGQTTERVKMNPGGGSPNLVEPAGPTDPTVSFVAVREAGGRMLSVYSAYSLHYVGGCGDAHISADYFGMYCEALKKMQKGAEQEPAFVAMMANGTSGDVNNVNFTNPRPRREPYAQMADVARDIAVKVNAALSGLEWKSAITLDARKQEPGIRWRVVEPELSSWAETLEPNPWGKRPTKTDLSTLYAGRVLRLKAASPETKAPVQVLRVGDVCIGTSPCETFAETGLEFKKRSPFRNAFMVELANGYYGYLPTPRHFELGGYETWPGTNYLERGASVKVLDAVLEMAGAVLEASKQSTP